MSCIKHHENIISYCQSCTVFACEKCPTHKFHVVIEYSLYLSQCNSEIEAFTKIIQAKQKMLEMLKARVSGYFESIDKNTQASIESIKSGVEELHKDLDQQQDRLTNEIYEIVEKISRPLKNYEEKIKTYIQELKHQIIISEGLNEKISSKKPQDPILIANDMKKLNLYEYHYIDTFIASCKKSLETKVPIIPIIGKNPLAIESSLFLDFTSKHLEIRPLFPY